MASIRFALLSCLNRHGQQTMDDLESQITDVPRKQIYNNLQPAKRENLISTDKDIVTGLPAYKITDAGKQWLAERGADDSEPAQQGGDVESVTASEVTDSDIAVKTTPVIVVTIAGPVGVGKTAVAKSVDEVLSAYDVDVRFEDDSEAREARDLALGELNPVTATVLLRVETELPVCCGADNVMATTASEVTGEYRTQVQNLTNQNRLLTSENAALRSHSLMLGNIAELVSPFDQESGATTLGVVETMVQLIGDQKSELDLAQQLVHRQELEAEQYKERIATLESNGDLLAETERFPNYKTLADSMVGELDGWRGLASLHGCSSPETLGDILKQRTDEMKRLRAENTALKILNEAMPGFGAAHEAIKADKNPPFYVSVGRNTGPQIHKDIEVATRRMKSIVRRGDPAGLVLVPILKAIKGVEIVEVKSA